MKPLFIAAGSREWGSSRMRSYWVSEKINGASVTPFETVKRCLEVSPYFDRLIWQKNIDLDIVEAFPNAKHYWDVCDPAWWWNPKQCREIADAVSGVVASSKQLAYDFNQWYGAEKAVTIADRINLSAFPRTRTQEDVSPVRFIWYGVAVNRMAIMCQLVNLERLVANGYRIELTVFDDRPSEELLVTDSFPIYHKRWSLASENEVLAAHDIALLPPYPGAWGRVKSNNKRLTAWASGLPVVSDEDYGEIKELVSDPMLRKERCADNYRELQQSWTVDKSAAEWEQLLK